MPQRVNRGGSRVSTKKTAKSSAKKTPVRKKAGKPGLVKLGIMGDGVYDACVDLGTTTIQQLFDQVNEDSGCSLKAGESLWLNGKSVKASAKITKNGSTITSTKAVKGA